MSRGLLASDFKWYLDTQMQDFKQHLNSILKFASADYKCQWDLGLCGEEDAYNACIFKLHEEYYLSQLIS